jgi:hypothetical protein
MLYGSIYEQYGGTEKLDTYEKNCIGFFFDSPYDVCFKSKMMNVQNEHQLFKKVSEKIVWS